MTDFLTDSQTAEARLIFEGRMEGVSACWFCAGIHARVANLPSQLQPCPRVKRVEFYADGTTVQAVEFWPNGEWEADVVFPNDVWPDGDENTDERGV